MAAFVTETSSFNAAFIILAVWLFTLEPRIIGGVGIIGGGGVGHCNNKGGGGVGRG